MASPEFVEEYRLCLVEDLCVNSKPVIDNLTTLAAENKSSAHLLVGVICERILNCQADDKLPALYLLDSICKNVGEPFVALFANRLPEVFCCVWRAGNAATHKQLLKLYFTWKMVFPSTALIMIDATMRQMNKPTSGASRASEVLEHKDVKSTAQAGLENDPVEHAPMRRTGADPGLSPASATNEEKDAGYENGKEYSEIGQISDGMTVNVSSLVSLLLQSAAAGVNSKSDAGSCVLEAKELTPAVVKSQDPLVLQGLREGSKKTKPKFLDWRFQMRRDRRRKTYRTRKWYADPERWIHDCNPVDISPLELVAKLTEAKEIPQEKHIVRIDDDNPQTHCEISGDKLEKYFDDELEDWYYKDCKRIFGEEAKFNSVRDGAIVIVSCLRKHGEPLNGKFLGVNSAPSSSGARAVSSALAEAANDTTSDWILKNSSGKRRCSSPDVNGHDKKKFKDGDKMFIKGNIVA